MLMLDTGMRRAEALGMTWSDVSVENRSILIEQQFAADRSVRSPKSKKSVRRISISETLTSYLEFWKRSRPAKWKPSAWNKSKDNRATTQGNDRKTANPL